MDRIDIRRIAKRTARGIWRWLRWILLASFSTILVLELMAIVNTRVWSVLELLVVPAALVVLVRWLDRQEAKRQKAEKVERERHEIEIDYKLGLLELETEYPRKTRKAAARLDASKTLELQQEYADKKKRLEKTRELRLAQLEENESPT